MRIAVCSLSEYTHVSEFLDAATALGTRHELRYFPGYPVSDSASLLRAHGIEYDCSFRSAVEGVRLAGVDRTAKTKSVFVDYFFKHAELALPGLIERFDDWRPDLVLSHLRDYAGSTAAEYLDIPLVSFGSHQSPWRIEPVDPPFGAGRARTDSPRRLQLAWYYHRRFNEHVDEIFNSMVRAPLGLCRLRDVSTFHSRRLTLLSLPAFMSNKNSFEPGHVHFVGPQFTRRPDETNRREQDLLSFIDDTMRPRVLVALGTTYSKALLPVILAALREFPGAIVVAGRTTSDLCLPSGTISGFFHNVDALHCLCDAVVTTGSGKSATDALRHGIPMVCVPRQGEQMENALALESLGVALTANVTVRPRRPLVDQLLRLIEDAEYGHTAAGLADQFAGRLDSCLKLIEDVREPLQTGGAG